MKAPQSSCSILLLTYTYKSSSGIRSEISSTSSLMYNFLMIKVLNLIPFLPHTLCSPTPHFYCIIFASPAHCFRNLRRCQSLILILCVWSGTCFSSAACDATLYCIPADHGIQLFWTLSQFLNAHAGRSPACLTVDLMFRLAPSRNGMQAAG